MVCLRNICINTLHKGYNNGDYNDDDDDDDNDNDNNNNNINLETSALYSRSLLQNLITTDGLGRIGSIVYYEPSCNLAS